MRAGDVPKQEKCDRTDSVEDKTSKAGGTNQHRNCVFWDTGIYNAILGVSRRI